MRARGLFTGRTRAARRRLGGALAAAGIFAGGLTVGAPVAPVSAAAGIIQGTVFRDFNADGVMNTTSTALLPAIDVGVGGVTVRAYDATGAQLGPGVVTAANGAYVLSHASTSAQVRVEFEVPAGYLPGPHGQPGAGVRSGTSVQFVADTASNVSFGIMQPGDYAQPNPTLVIPSIRGLLTLGANPSSLAALPSLYALNYTTTGLPGDGTGAADKRPQALQSQTGSIWGVADYGTDWVFTGAFFKRHAPVGANGLGQIYLTEVDSGAPNAAPWVTIPNAGANPRPIGADNGALTTYDWFHDVSAFAKVYKIGLGDVDMSADGSTLYAVNLNDRQVWAVPVVPGATTAIAPTPGTPVAIPLPLDLPGAATGCDPDWLQAFGLEPTNDGVFVTLTCTGPAIADLRAYVYRFTEGTNAFDATPAFELGLSGYERGYARFLGAQAEWNPWADTYNFAGPGGIEQGFPQPILSDIVFDKDGDMTLSLRDRFADQAGFAAGNLNVLDLTGYYGMPAGDLLRACGTPASGWTLENNGFCGGVAGFGVGNAQGPGGGEFYDDTNAGIHDQASTGALTQVPGFPEVVTTQFDPTDAIYTDGYQKASNTNGAAGFSNTIVSGTGNGSFGKAASLGDIEALLADAPVEIGNRVWYDTDGDGIQDAGELPIAGVEIMLLIDPIGPGMPGGPSYTAVTDANGNYYFSSAAGTSTGSAKYGIAELTEGTQYSIGAPPNVSLAPVGSTGYTTASGTIPAQVTVQDNDSSPGGDDRDSDVDVTNCFTDTFTIGGPGENNHSHDIGYFTGLSLGNQVWLDTGAGSHTDNGVKNAEEVGVDNVTVQLLHGDGTPYDADPSTPDVELLAVVTTNGGYYRFDNLPAGDYRVLVTASNFGPGEPLAGHLSSTFSTPDFETIDNNTDHGEDAADPTLTGVTSEVVTLYPAGSTPPHTNPTGDVDAGAAGQGMQGPNGDGADNLTVDFGFVLVVESYDLALVKVAGATSVDAQFDLVTWTVRVRNQGTLPAGAFTVTDTLPAGMSFVSCTAPTSSCNEAGGIVTATYTNLLPGDSADISIVTQVEDLSAGPFRNWAEITADSGDDDDSTPGANADPTDDPYVSQDELDDLDVDGPAGPEAGQTDADDNDDAAVGAVVTYSLGNRLWADTGTGAGEYDNGRYNVGEQPITSATVELRDGLGNPIDPDGPGPLASTTTTTDAAGYYRFDGLEPGTYTVHIPASNFVLPVGRLYGYVSSTGDTDTFAIGDNNADHGIDDPDPMISGISSAPIAIGPGTLLTGDVDPGATPAGLHGPTGDVYDNLTVDFGFVKYIDLTLAKTLANGPGPYQAGDTVTFDLVVTNNGPSTAQAGLEVTDRLPAGLTFVNPQVSSPGWICDPAVGQEITCMWVGGSGLFPGTPTQPLNLQATIDSPVTATSLDNVAYVVPATGDVRESNPVGSPDPFENGDPLPGPGGPSNNDDSVPVPLAIYDLALVKISTTPNVDSNGDTINWVIRVTNQGTVPSGTFSVRDTFPAGTFSLPLLGCNLGCLPGVGNTVTWSDLGPLEPDGFVDLTLQTIVQDIDQVPFRNWAEISADSGNDDDSTPDTNTGQDDTLPNDGYQPQDVLMPPPPDGPPGPEPTGNVDSDDNDDAVVGREITYSLGNRLWLDTGAGAAFDNGEFDTGELPVPDGVTVALLNADGSPALDADGVLVPNQPTLGGYYRFDNLAAGDYRVLVLGTNFALPTLLGGYSSSTGASADFTVDGNDFDHGIDDPAPVTNGIRSGIVSLGPPSDPVTGEVDGGATGLGTNGPLGDPYDNLTVDFGFITHIDLTIDKTLVSGSGPYFAGDSVQYAIAVMNNGPGTAMTGFTVTDRLPAGLSFDGAPPTGTPWECAAPVGQQITCTWTGAAVAPGSILIQLELRAIVDTPVTATTLTNDAFVAPNPADVPETNPLSTEDGGFENGNPTPGPGNPSNNDDSVPIPVASYDLALAKITTTGSVDGNGDQVVWTIEVRNQGTVNSGDFEVTDTLPAGMSFASCSDGCTDNGDGTVTWSLGDLAPAAANDGTEFIDLTLTTTVTNITLAPFRNWAEISADDGPDDDSTPDTTTGSNGTMPNDPYVSKVLGDLLADGPAGPEAGQADADDNDDALVTRDLVYALGNRLWFDTRAGAFFNNGVADALEGPVTGAEVELLDGSGNSIDPDGSGGLTRTLTTTDLAGYYRFDGLAAGDYQVLITPANFATGGVLAAYLSSTPTSTTFLLGDNDLDHGINATDPAVTGIRSNTVNPAAATPVGDANGVTAGPGANAPSGDDSDNLTVDFGFIQAFAVGDYVWIDADGDGVQDAGEPPKSGVTVELQNPNGTPATDVFGNPIAPTTTDPSGHYVFDNVPPGTYIVEFSNLPAGHVITPPTAPGSTPANDSNPNPGTGVTPPFNVGPLDPDTRPVVAGDGTTNAVEINPTIDAGLIPLVAVGDYTWVDVDRDGVQEVGEPALSGVTVELLTALGASIDPDGIGPLTKTLTTTNALGWYAFDKLLPGDYRIAFTLPTGYVYTQTGGGTSADDSNPVPDAVTPALGLTPVFTIGGVPGGDTRASTFGDGVTAPLINPTIDAGVVPLVAVGDYVWIDSDRDGIQDAGELPLEGVHVTLQDPDGTPAQDANGNPVSADTGPDGGYLIDNLLPGDYVVQFELPPGYVFTTPEAPSSGVGSNPTPTDNPSVGRTDVFTISPTVSGDTVVDDDEATIAHFVNPTIDAGVVPVVAVGDYVWQDLDGDGIQFDGEPPLPGVLVELQNPDGTPAIGADGLPVPADITDVNGHYLFDGVLPGDYIVEFTLPSGYVYTVPGAGDDEAVDSNPVPDGNSPTGVTPVFTVSPSVTGGTVADDDDDTDAIFVNPTIDAGVLPVVAVGDYTWIDGNRNGVQDPGEAPLPGVLVQLLNPDSSPAVDVHGAPVPWVMTDADGHYLFDGLTPGDYRVQFTLPAGQQFTVTGAGTSATDSNPVPTGNPSVGVTPVFTVTNEATGDTVVDTDPATVAGFVNPTIDAGIVPIVAICDYTWIDSNRNGVQDVGEPALPGVTVELLNSDGSPATHADGSPVAPVVTDGNGHYLFDNLLPGDFQVRFTLPPGHVFAPTGAGTSATDSNPTPTGNPSMGLTPVFTVSPNVSGDTVLDTDPATVAGLVNPTIDAGVVPVVAVGDHVWVDTDRDGVQDAGEPPLPGVTVELLNPDGSPATHVDGTPVAPVVTDPNGHYVFDDLVPGDYRIRFTPPENHLPTGTGGGDPATDSNPDGSGVTPVFTIGVVPGGDTRTSTPGDAVHGSLINPTVDGGFVVRQYDLVLVKRYGSIDEAAKRITWNFTVNNTGPDAAVGAVTVTDVLPAELGFVSGGSGDVTCTASGQTVTCTSPAGLPAGAMLAFSIVTSYVNLTSSITNSATVSGGGPGESTTTNNVSVSVAPFAEELPATGSDISRIMAWATALLLLGALGVVGVRRRRTSARRA